MANKQSLKDINARLKALREQSHEEAKRGSGARTRKMDGDVQDVSQATIFDEIDKFKVVAAQISSGKVVDFAIKDALATVSLVAERLNDPDITGSERKGLGEHLKVAEQQLEMGSVEGLSDEQAKSYKSSVAQVQKEIDSFKDIAKKGTQDFSSTKEFISKQKEDAMGMLIGTLTQNPALMIAYKLFSDYKGIKKKNETEAKTRLSDSRRAQITQLEEQKTVMKEAGEDVSPQVESVDDLMEAAGQETTAPTVESGDINITGAEADYSGMYDAVRSGIVDGLGGMAGQMQGSDIDVLAGDMTKNLEEATDSVATEIATNPQLRAELESMDVEDANMEIQEMILKEVSDMATISKATYEVLQGVEKETEKARAVAEKSALHDQENRLEEMRKRGVGGVIKDKIKDAKEGIGDFLENIKDMALIFMAYGGTIFRILKSFGTKILGPLAVIGTTLFAGFKAFQAWGDSEGKDLSERISLTARAYGDAILGLFGTSGTEISTALLDTFEAVADWWENFSLVDQIKEMFGFGETKEVKQINKTAEEATQGSDAAKEAFSTGTLGFGDSINIDNEEALKNVDSPSLRAIFKSEDATDDTKEKITAELKRREEPLIMGVGKEAPSMAPQTQPNVDRQSFIVSEITSTINENRQADKEASAANQAPVIVNNTSNSSNTTVTTKSMPVTGPLQDTARLQGGYA